MRQTRMTHRIIEESKTYGQREIPLPLFRENYLLVLQEDEVTYEGFLAEECSCGKEEDGRIIDVFVLKTNKNAAEATTQKKECLTRSLLYSQGEDPKLHL